MNPQSLGQAAEFLVWTQLVAQGLRLYLPTLDMGDDGAVRGPGGVRFVQVKGCLKLQGHSIHEHLTRNEARFPDDLVVIVHLNSKTMEIDDPVFVIPIGQVLATQPAQPDERTDAYSIEIAWPPTRGHKWFSFAVDKSALTNAVLPVPEAEAMPPALPTPQQQEVDGFRAEAEFVAQLAKSPALNSFRAFPDMGFCEFLVRSRMTGRAAGVQVKCAKQRARHESVSFHIKQATFSAEAGDYLLAVAIGHDQQFCGQTLVIPARELPGLCKSADGFYRFSFNPLDPPDSLTSFLCSIDDLAQRFEELLA